VYTGLVALLIAPAAWSATPVLYGGNETIPSAGPDLQHSKGMMGASSQGANGNTKLIDFLMKDYQEGTYLLAVTNANSASPIILQTGLPVMAMGGFIGSDPAITVDQLGKLAKAGKVKYFMTGGMGGGGGQSSEITKWIEQNCKVVPTSEYESTSTTSKGNGFMNRGPEMGGQLYEYVAK
jgi:4-amino-4-deoxy-L-arabinose transferase-like glycosyltransferase